MDLNLPITTLSVYATDSAEGRDMVPDELTAVPYHWLITRGGTMLPGLQEGVAGDKPGVINVVYVGGADKDGKPKDTRTDNQKAALDYKLAELAVRYPDAKVIGGFAAPKANPAPVPAPAPSLPTPMKDGTDDIAH